MLSTADAHVSLASSKVQNSPFFAAQHIADCFPPSTAGHGQLQVSIVLSHDTQHLQPQLQQRGKLLLPHDDLTLGIMMLLMICTCRPYEKFG